MKLYFSRVNKVANVLYLGLDMTCDDCSFVIVVWHSAHKLKNQGCTIPGIEELGFCTKLHMLHKALVGNGRLQN